MTDFSIQEAFEKCWAHSPLRANTLPFTRCRYCRTPPHSHAACASMSIDVHNDYDDNTWQRGPLWPHRMGPTCISLAFLYWEG